MKTLLALLTATSLSANAWLMLRTAPAVSVASEPTPPTARFSPPVEVSAQGSLPVTVLEAGDPAALRDQLRAAGADESVVRAIIDGALRRRYREQLAAVRIERVRDSWWRSGFVASGGDDAKLLKETVLAPLRELMGRDPLDRIDAENRYRFLPPEKRRLLAEIALDYHELEGAAGGGTSINLLKSEIDERRLLAEERRKDVLAALTPGERAEYDLRFENSAPILSGRLAAMHGTEQEFRALKPLLDDYKQQARGLPKDDGFSAAYAELQQRTMDQLVAAIGLDRALDYMWCGPGTYPETVRVAQELGLSATTAGRVLQLAAETGARAAALHHDGTIPLDGKRAALQELQATVRPAFDALVPESLRWKLPEQARVWFTLLEEGRYMGFIPSIDSTGSGTVVPISVTTPAVGRGLPPPPQIKAAGR